METKGLTTRQWRLYDYLKANSDTWTTQWDIYQYFKKNYPNDYIFYNGSAKEFHDSQARFEITLDIRDMNNSDVIQKIILSNRVGIKIANEEEYRKYSINKWRSIKGMIKRLAYKDHKASMNGQMKLVFGDSLARDFHEAFVKGEK